MKISVFLLISATVLSLRTHVSVTQVNLSQTKRLCCAVPQPVAMLTHITTQARNTIHAYNAIVFSLWQQH